MHPTMKTVLPRTSPEAQGVDSSAILAFVEALERQINEIHSVMLLRHGSVIAEGWWSPYGREHRHVMFSLSKSFTSTAVGLAVAEGHFSIDDPVLSFFPDETPAEVGEHLAAMRVRHLLSMSTGQAEDTWGYMTARADGNWTQAFFDVPVIYPPGTHFLYNTGATYMLSAIVQKMTGEKLVDYLGPRLFAPLGIEGAVWDESPQGMSLGGIGLNIKTEDIARFGQLYLQKGLWNGGRILTEAWVDEATTAQVSNGDDPASDWAQGYGFQFWRCRHNLYRGDGAFGQYCIVMPEQDAVLAITGGVDALGMQPPLDLAWELLLPAMRDEPCPEDDAAHHRLTEKLASLALHPIQGAFKSPITAQISGHVYTVDENAPVLELPTLETVALKSVAVDFSDSGLTLRVKTARGETAMPCGYGAWAYGQATLFNPPWRTAHEPVAASAAWTAEDTLTIIVRRYTTPFYHTVVCHFIGDELMIEASVNTSFGSTQPILLMAKRI